MNDAEDVAGEVDELSFDRVGAGCSGVLISWPQHCQSLCRGQSRARLKVKVKGVPRWNWPL